MSGPPPPPPPPGPPPPPAMAPPQISKSEQHGRSALLTDITKGAKLKSAKHLMSDRSGLQTGGNTGKGGGASAGMRPAMPPGCENGRGTTGRTAVSPASNRAELICYPVPAPRSITVGYSNSFSGVGSTARHPPSVPQRPVAPHHHQAPGASGATIQHSRSLREKPLGPPPPPPLPSCPSSSWSPASSSSSLHNGGRPPGGAGTGGAGTVRNAPAGLGDLFGGGIPRLRGAGSNTVGRSAVNRGGDRASNGSVDNFPPPPPLSSKPSADYPDGASSATVGRSSGSRMSGGGFPPPPSPSQLSRPPPGVPGGPRPSGPPPPPTRAPPPQRPHENGSTTTQGYNTNRALPQTPSGPPKPPERKDSVGPPPPPFRVPTGPPPPPNRVPPSNVPPPVRSPGGVVGKSGPPRGPPPPPGPLRTHNGPPPPPPVRPPAVSINRPPPVVITNRTNSVSEFEANFMFPTDLPRPEHFTPSNKTYPSQNPGKKGSTNANRRPVPPPPPPGGP